MKKIGMLCMVVLLLTGCTDMMNTPTKRVEEFLGKYQIMDHEVLEQLDTIIDKEESLKGDQKNEYRTLMEKQYQNLSYKIKNETVNGDQAEVTVEVSVFDYKNANKKAEEYIEKNADKFETDGKRDKEKEMDYKIKQMQSVTDKIQYTITFQVKKNEEQKRWILEKVSDDAILKLHGLYDETE